MTELRAAVASRPDFPPVLFVHQESAEEGEAFFHKFWPEARAVSDRDMGLNQAFGIEQGRWSQVLGPQVVGCSLRAMAKGHVGSLPTADPWMMPGYFLVQGERVLWQHDAAHIGDHPDLAAIPGLAAPFAQAKPVEIHRNR